MKTLIILFASICIYSNSFTQTYKVQWGDEMKVKKGSMDMDIVHADKSGVYMIEGRMKMKSYFVVGYSVTEAYKLYKFDPNYDVVYDKEYKKELKGLSFNSIQPLQGQLYLFAHDYKKKDKEYIIYGAKINNNTGNVDGDMQELCSFQLDSKKDDLDFIIKPTDDSTQWIIVGDITDDVSSGISVYMFDKNLVKKTSARINMGFAPGTFDLESITQVTGNKLLLMGKQYEVTETGKKKRKVRTFKKYVLSRYSSTGKKETEINMDIGDKYTISGRLIPQKSGEIYLAGFYSNSSKRDQINGVLIYKIDVANGVLLQSAFQEVNNNMLSKPINDDADNDEETKTVKKDMAKAESDGEADGFSSVFIIRDIIQSPETNSLLLIAEAYSFNQYSYTTSTYNSLRKTWEYRTRTVFSFTNNDMLVINTDLEKNKIKQVTIIPKSQVEHISDYSGAQSMPNMSNTVGMVSFFAKGGGMPFYSSFTAMLVKNKLVFLFNDHSNNANVKTSADKVKTVTNFKKSVAYGISLDLANGEVNRRVLLSNEDEPVLMPRFGFVVDNEVYMPAMKMKGMGKSEMKMGKITIK
jgi:hypothetical protein